jgi:hypothetical protein
MEGDDIISYHEVVTTESAERRPPVYWFSGASRNQAIEQLLV